jgi:hypothetical protein
MKQMMDMTTYIRRVIRQTCVLMGVVGVTFAAGINWAEAATSQSGVSAPAQLHVILLFMATIGILVQLMAKPRRRVRVRNRARIVRNNRR